MASADDRKETSLRACVAHMLGIDVSEVPTKREANMGQWLASRNLGLVPVASPETFQWPGLFLGLRRDSSTWAVYFGVPPGIVHDPMAEADGKGEAALDEAFVLAQQDPARRRACFTYATAVSLAQAGWIALLIAETSVLVTFLWAAVLVLVELAGPVVADRGEGGTPWHPHHIAERYGLLVIIALGEALLGTTVALSAIIEGPGWSTDVVVLGLAGTAMTFGMWWVYFVVPSGVLLARHRERSWGWGYGHIVLFGALVAVGAGLHAAAYHVEEHSELGVPGTLLTVAVPLAVYVLSFYALYAHLVRAYDTLDRKSVV